MMCDIMQVRGHAVNILTAKEDEELLSVLLQLVQARLGGMQGGIEQHMYTHHVVCITLPASSCCHIATMV